jgi:hypothetical protein
MALKYASGDDIQLGEKVNYDGLRGSIELLADPEAPGAPDDWYVQEYGSGVTVAEPTVLGRVFVSAPETDDCLVLVGRKA